jgi:hypothetical protein
MHLLGITANENEVRLTSCASMRLTFNVRVALAVWMVTNSRSQLTVDLWFNGLLIFLDPEDQSPAIDGIDREFNLPLKKDQAPGGGLTCEEENRIARVVSGVFKRLEIAESFRGQRPEEFTCRCDSTNLVSLCGNLHRASNIPRASTGERSKTPVFDNSCARAALFCSLTRLADIASVQGTHCASRRERSYLSE